MPQIAQTSSNIGQVKTCSQVNGPLPESCHLEPLPKQCQVLKYFDSFMQNIEYLERIVDHNSEINVTTFMSTVERDKREVFDKKFRPFVMRLRHGAIA